MTPNINKPCGKKVQLHSQLKSRRDKTLTNGYKLKTNIPEMEEAALGSYNDKNG